MPDNNCGLLRIGVYVGEGASHSWTWFVDLLEKYPCGWLSFLDERRFVREAGLQDVILLSGGDTFAVAGALGPDGAAALKAFVEGGGLYIGSCAGAYLPLFSSKEPLCDFNFVRAKINNLARDLPPVRALPGKFSTAYGCSYIIHPAREEVRVRLAADFPVLGGREIRVPLYGGPPLQPSEDAEPWAWYSGFTERTLFLTDAAVADKVYLGKVAACEKRIGKGRMVLLGPHFEHPGFPEGNEVIRYWLEKQAECGAGAVEGGRLKAGGPYEISDQARACLSPRGLRALKTEVSNMRIRANALARKSVSWRIGHKVYEPEKAAYFVDTIWKRLRRMRAAGDESHGLPLSGHGSRRAEHAAQGIGGDRIDGAFLSGIVDALLSGAADCHPAEHRAREQSLAGEDARIEEALLSGAADCHQQIRRLSERIAQNEETQAAAEEMFRSLKALTAAFLEVYFTGCRVRHADLTAHAGVAAPLPRNLQRTLA